MAKLASPTDKRRKFRAILKRKQLTVMPSPHNVDARGRRKQEEQVSGHDSAQLGGDGFLFLHFFRRLHFLAATSER